MAEAIPLIQSANAVVQVLADEARASAALADDKGSLGVAPNSLIFWK